MRDFIPFGSSFRVPALLVAAATLAQAGPWQPVGRAVSNQSRQPLTLKGNLIASFAGMDLGFRIVSGSGSAAPAGEPEPFPQAPIVLPHGQTLQLYYRFSEAAHVAGSDLIAVTDASGVSCGDLAVEVNASGATLDRAKVSIAEMGLAKATPGVSTVAMDGSAAEAIVFGASASQGAWPAPLAMAIETKETPAAAALAPARETKALDVAMAAAATFDGERKDLPRTLIIGQKPRERVECALSLGEFGKELVLTDAEGRAFKFAVEPVPATHLPSPPDIPVDLIGDVSGSMASSLAKDRERPGAVPRSVAHERIYRAVRKKFPVGLNLVFDDLVRGWDLERAMPSGGGTDLTTCLRTCRPAAITVIFTDDKGFVLPQEAFAEGRQKLIVPCLLTAFDIDVEFDTKLAAASPGQKRINGRYRFTSGTSASNAPGFGAAMMGQRDLLSLIRVDTAYNDKGEVSDQGEIVDRIATAIEKARTAQFWRITNPTKSEFVIHCPSGRGVCILPGTCTTIAPDPTDLKGFSRSNVYIHTPR
jgi:hypothetical protein